MAILLKRFQKFLQAPQEWLLIEEAKRGDKEAFGKLYEIYLDQIYRYILFHVGQKREVAEDLTADVFMKAWTKITTFEKDLPAGRQGSIKSWLYKIAKNTAIDHFRVSKQQISLDESVAEEKESLEDTVGRMLTVEKVKEAMKKLTKDQQEVLLLKFVEDFSNKEIARLLEKNEEAIRAVVYRAIKELKEELRD